MFKKISVGLSILSSYVIIFFAQITLNGSGISVDPGDVEKLTEPMYDWFGSLFNLFLSFATPIIVFFVVMIIIHLISKRRY